MTAGLTDGLGTTERATRFGPKIHVTAGTLPSAVFGAVDDVRTPLVPAVGAVEPALYFRSVYRSLTDENGAEPTTLDRLPVSTWLRTPPVDLAGARDAENFTPRGPVGQVAPKPLLDMGVSGHAGVEAVQANFVATAFALVLLIFDLRVAVCTEDTFKGICLNTSYPQTGHHGMETTDPHRQVRS